LLAPLGFAARVDAVAGRSLPADFTSRRCSFGKNLIAAGRRPQAAGRRKATGVVISGSKGALFGGGHKFDPETIRVMGLAFEMAPAALRLIDRGDLGAAGFEPLHSGIEIRQDSQPGAAGIRTSAY
jgi:hypothetical protein